MKKSTIFLAGIIVIAFVAILLFINNSNDTENNDVAQNTNIKELVHEHSLYGVPGEVAIITGTELIIEDSKGNEEIYPLPNDEFFVSIAPYIDVTHPCTYHNLTGCQGELIEEDFDVFIKDEDGNVILDDVLTTLPNGFIDLWLPRNKTYEVSIFQDEKRVQAEISSFDNDATCITTMQLS